MNTITMKTETVLAQTKLVEREARRLDRLFPNWATKINPGTLSLPTHNNCILGQITGSYLNGWRFVQADQLRESSCYETNPYIWPRYESLWLEEVAKRVN